ncbi:uncharacterized protein MYCFIDRAFT_166988 [Pseudocercospora fijiensis CIRAD86]|uniref:Uncharacterized protein n=1 Tax=Pseudocercospora fijiensis (strain CIRAD86) TaxID=383855 RepID=M2ZJ02_PSEFD|nr:uncharacterized protein MYCFIDRAFT_166988 [Pseudocercospora fijiensis CIRAD86]EME79084.1 hypothetical protein MYCFIDRAFT_166988 [Pseudocercospora fijiensis CIRAD86]
MALRLPGAISTPEDFWHFLLDKGDARSRVPASRYNIDSYYVGEANPGTVQTEHGYFLDDENANVRDLDASMFSIPRAELRRVDPHQRMMLEVARECLEDAGEVGWAGSRIGCYMGSFGEDWCEMFAKDPQQYGLHRVAGYGDYMLSNRVSYELDLHGPSMTIRTGCSAALVALHEACRAIQHGDCDAALVGGANLILAPGMTTAMTEQGVLAKDGSCKTFSADANGYGRGEAINAVFIKPVRTARRDGNPIRAVIRATATNNDGHTPGISYPSGTAQEAMMRHAYATANLDPTETTFVECHGTGTPVGDPIESNAVGRVFSAQGSSDRTRYIGSVKPNMGHSEGASGLTSLVKVVMSLEKRTIAPNIKFRTPNPEIKFDEYRMTVPTEPTPWPQNRAERASINSFGIGGSNAHVILDSAASLGLTTMAAAHSKPLFFERTLDVPRLLLLSGATISSVTRLGDLYAHHVQHRSDCHVDVSHTLANHREHLPYRSYAVARSQDTLSFCPPVKTPQISSNLVMIFTGQGSQWPGMGSHLLCTQPAFRAAISRLDQQLQRLPQPPEWSIAIELCKESGRSRVYAAEFAQPLTTAVQIALVDLFASFGVRPSAVVGHSSGEIAAAYAAGALTSYEAMAASLHRGLITRKAKRAGAMAAVGLSWSETVPYLRPGVTIACDNSPTSVTISGDADVLGQVVEAVRSNRPEVLARPLKVDQAYHSQHMVDIGDDYCRSIENLVEGTLPTRALFFSSVNGRSCEHDLIMDAKYWQMNLESPVLFRTALENLINNPISSNAVFLEIGPHAALAGPSRQILAHAGIAAPYVTAMNRASDSSETFLSAIGKLYQLGIAIDFTGLVVGGKCLSGLPRYPWDHSACGDYWYESRLSKNWRLKPHPHHDLLGSRTLESSELEPSWRNILHLDSSAGWVRDHCVGDDIVFPIAGYVAMAAEAVRQLAGDGDGVSFRQVAVRTALVLFEERPVELLTTLRHHRLTDDLDSEWWEFVISSTNGSVWTKHCSGQVRGRAQDVHTMMGSTTQEHARIVDSRRWYDTFARVGLNYGPHFQRLGNIRSATTRNEASANLPSSTGQDQGKYYMHPTILDAALQMSSIAHTRGIYKDVLQTWLPIRIEDMSIKRSDIALDLVATSALMSGGNLRGCIQATANGSVVLDIQGMVLSPLKDTVSKALPDTHTTSRLEWREHIDFMQVTSLIKPSVDRSQYTLSLDELSTLCVLHTKQAIADCKSDPTLPHLDRFRQWLDAYNPAFPNTRQSSDRQGLMQRIRVLQDELADTPAAVAAAAMETLRSSIEDIFTGRTDALELLQSDGTLAELYNFISQVNHSDLLRHLGHTKPTMRILELGAGTDMTTATILQDVNRPECPVSYQKYTFTDVSSSRISAAKESCPDVANLEFATLDINQDPLKQGFEEESYDLVIATNALHTTDNLTTTLGHVRKLLRPDGRLVLHEICSTSKWLNYIFGLMPSWWNGEADGRVTEPYITPELWRALLSDAGFSSIEGPVYDTNPPFQLSATIVARPQAEHPGQSAERAMTLIVHDVEMAPTELIHALSSKGYKVDVCDIRQRQPAPNIDQLAILDESGPYFDHLSDARLKRFQNLIATIGQAGCMWMTKPSQLRCIDPRYAQILGAARSVRSELAVDLAVCECDREDNDSWDTVVDVFTHFLQNRKKSLVESDLGPDYEYAIRKNKVYVGRYHPFDLQAELKPLCVEAGEKQTTLEVDKLGLTPGTKWFQRPIAALADDDVEVEVYSTGLNFRDILGTVGVVNVGEDGLGLEAAGVVRRTGRDVMDLAVGDRVLLLGGPAFSTHVVTSHQLCQRIPAGLSFDEAATMPCVYGTAIYSVFDTGRLTKGQSILIHSACGGVGLAAIQLAQMVGAEIFATVGNDEKVLYLMKTFNIPRDHIFNSRDTSFVRDLKLATKGRGVDLVLNSLSGELLHASWQCVAEFGKMVEIGKKDILGSGKLDMSPFLANRSFCCVDLDELCKKQKSVVSRLLHDMIQHYGQKYINPIQPMKTFPASNVEDAFRYMQKGQHLGKIIVQMRDHNGELRLSNDHDPKAGTDTLRFDPQAAYLLIGGLGGLGRAVASWMVEHGARHLIFMSRSAGQAQSDKDFIAELESIPGCAAQVVRGSVADYDAVQQAMEQATLPIKGILQMSMVLRDQNFARMSHDEWLAAVDPKLTGTWNLHHAAGATGQKLDFFVLFSSVSATIGQPGQANYNAANAFMTAFAQYRRKFGLPASVIDVGAMEEVGHIANDTTLLRKVKASAAYALRERELLEALHLAILIGNSPCAHDNDEGFVPTEHFVLGMCSLVPISSPESRALWKTDRRMGVFHNTRHTQGTPQTSSSSSSDSALLSFLLAAQSQPELLQTPSARTFVATEIGKKLFEMLLRPAEDLEISRSLTDLGMDSFVAIEVRAWWKQVFRTEVSVLEILGQGSMEELGGLAIEKFMRRA